jgi:hypothetical protein
VEIVFQKINCGFFAARGFFRQNRVPKIPWRACGNFVPKNQLRLFRRTQSFPPKQSAQDSMESQTSQPHHVHVQWRGCIRFLPLKSTLLCCHPEYLFFSSVEISAFHRYCVAQAWHPH